MATLSDLIRNSPKTDFPALSGMWYATIVAPLPVNRNQLLSVVIPDIDRSVKWSNVKYPKGQFNNISLGGQVLVAFDNRQQLWVISQVLSSPLVTTSDVAGGPPANPSDGDIWIATNVDANGTRWQFQYNASSASVYKWEFIGGSALSAAIQPASAVNTTGWQDTTTPGPQVTLPRAGDWRFAFGCRVDTSTANQMYCGVKTTDVNPAGVQAGMPVPLNQFATIAADFPPSMDALQRGVPAGTVAVFMQYTSVLSGNFYFRYLHATPTRIS